MGRGERVAEEMFGSYRLERLLGGGGMGEVWRAVDMRRQRPVAVKRLRAQLSRGAPEVVARFQREAELTARLNDPHVIPIHDYGEIRGQLYIDISSPTSSTLSTANERDECRASGRAGQRSGRGGSAPGARAGRVCRSTSAMPSRSASSSAARSSTRRSSGR